jgi:Fumarylacetoacetate (FAA) hydrolase family
VSLARRPTPTPRQESGGGPPPRIPRRPGQPRDKGKNCETFNPLGPWLVTADEVDDPQALALRLWVNGELRQDGDTKDMIFGWTTWCGTCRSSLCCDRAM